MASPKTKRQKKAKKPINSSKKDVPKLKNSRVTEDGKRIRNIQKHRSLKLSKKTVKVTKTLPSISELVKDPVKLIFKNKRVFFGLTFVYALLGFVFIKGLGTAFNLVETKAELNEYFGDQAKSLETSFILVEQLVSNINGPLGEVGGTYQLFFAIILILAVLWVCRKLFAGEAVSIRDAFYKGMYPIIPFILVLLVITIQMIPASVGSFLLTTVITNELAVTFLEKFLWFLIFALLALFSLYMVTSSIFALCIVTLQDLTPMQALRSARELVLHRRVGVFARLLILPVLILLILALVFMPLVLIAPLIAEPVFLLMTAFALIFSVVYVYNLYRKLL